MVAPSPWANIPTQLSGFDARTDAFDDEATRSRPAVADQSGENFGVIYVSTVLPPDPGTPVDPAEPAPGTYVRFQAFDHVLAPLDEVLPGPVTLSDGEGEILDGPLSIVSWGDGYVGAWQERVTLENGDPGPVLLRARATSPTGLLGPEFSLSDSTDPTVVQRDLSMSFYEKVTGTDAAGEDIVSIGFSAVWVEEAGGDTGRIKMQRYEVLANALGEPERVAPAGLDGEAATDDNTVTDFGPGRDPSVAVLHDGEAVLVWIDENDNLQGEFFPTLQTVGTVDLDTALAGITVPPGQVVRAVSLGAGNFGVFWVSQKEGGYPGDLVILGQTFALVDGATNDWVPQGIKQILDLPEGEAGYTGVFNVSGLGEDNDGGVVSYATTDGTVHAVSFDPEGDVVAGEVAQTDPSLNGSGGFGVAALVSDRFVVVGGDGNGGIRAQMMDTRDPNAEPVVISGDEVRDDDGNGIPERVRARPDLIVGTIGDDIIVADRGDEEDGDSDTDTVFGGMGNDIVHGGGDNDVLDGGVNELLANGAEGSDVATYRGGREFYSITTNGDGSLTVKDMRLTNGGRDPGPDGQDVVNNFEKLAFNVGVGAALGQGATLVMSPESTWVSTTSFVGGTSGSLPPVFDMDGTPQAWGLESTASFAVNTGPTQTETGVVQDNPIAVAMEDNFAFVWQAGDKVFLKAFDTLGQHDPAFGGAAVVYELTAGEGGGAVSGLAASVGGSLGVVAVWEVPVDPADPDGPTRLVGRHASSVNGPTGSGEFQVAPPAPGLSQREAAVVGYEVVDANNDTVEFGFNVVYTEGAGDGPGQIIVSRFIIPFDVNTEAESAPVPAPLNDTSGDRLVIAENGRDASAVSLHDGELVVTYIDGGILKAAVLVASTEGTTTSFAAPDIFNVAQVPAGATQQVASLTSSFVVAYTTTTLVNGEVVPAIQAKIMAQVGESWEEVGSTAPLVMPAGFTGEFQLSPTAENDAGGGFALYWQASETAGGPVNVFTQVFANDGTTMGDVVTVFDGAASLSAGGFSAAGLTDGRLVITAAGQVATTSGDPDSGGIVGQVLDTRTPGEQIIGPREGAPDDILVGSAFGDAIDGREGDDELHGGGGNDFLAGGSEIDTLFGGADNDTLLGGSENDVLNGEDGDDLLLGGFGADVIDGGEGSDTISYQGEFANFTINLAGGTTVSDRDPATGALGASGLEDTFLRIEHATGGEGSDVITGDADANELIGNGGNDTLSGGIGDDWLHGNAGNDTLNGGDGDDQVEGGSGNDTIVGGAGTDTLFFAHSRAAYTVTSQGGNFTIRHNITDAGGDGVDTFSGIEFVDFAGVRIAVAQLVGTNPPAPGTPGAPIVGTNAGETLQGTPEADLILGRGGNDILNGLAGDDVLEGGSGNDRLVGGNGNDTLLGEDGADTLIGGLNNDRLEGGAGVDSLDGGAGADTLLGGGGSDNLQGGVGVDSLSGGLGLDTLDGGDGADILDGGQGADTMTGGLGNDIYFVDNGADVVVEGAGAGIDTVQASVSYTLTANVENLEFTPGTVNDAEGTGNGLANVITGNDGNNRLLGRGGRDTLFGNGGNDILDGGAGADAMTGGTGDDLYLVDNLGDTVAEGIGDDQGIDTVAVSLTQAGTPFVLTGGLENLVFTGGADLDAIGSDLNNSITGNLGANSLSGGEGSDTLGGDGGNDTLAGGTGDDELNGGDGDDALDGGEGTDTAVIVGPAANYGFALTGSGISVTDLVGTGGVDTLSSIEQVQIEGQTLVVRAGDNGNGVVGGANATADLVLGFAGDDSVVGGLGRDTLIGGAGADVFLFGSIAAAGNGTDASTGRDVITDFSGALGDRINLLGIDAITGGGQDNFTFIGTGEFTGAGQLRYVQDGDITIIEGNVEGAGGAEFQIQLSGALALSGSDFILGNPPIVGTAGNDTLQGLAGNDLINGGAGTDTAVFAGPIGNYSFGLSGANITVTDLVGAGGTDTLISMEQLRFGDQTLVVRAGSDAGAKTVGVNNVTNLVLGFGGNDVLDARAGNDVVVGGLGKDTLIGGAGADTFLFSSVAEAGNGTSANTGRDVISDFNGVLGDRINLVGIDAIAGGARDSFTFIGTGEFTAAGQLRYVQDGANTIVEGNVEGAGGAEFQIQLSGALTLAATDFVLGSGGTTVVNGTDGNDVLPSGPGAETLSGGAGTDTAVFAGPIGNYSFSRSGANITVTDMVGAGGTDTLISMEQLQFGGQTLVVRAGDNGSAKTVGVNNVTNLVLGFGGNDVLDARAGNDVVVGGLGKDTLIGGAGADTFLFSSVAEAGNGTSANTGRDVVSDFNGVLGDRINLVGIDAIAGGARDSFTFIGTGEFTAAGQLRYVQDGANTIVEGNVEGAGGAEFQIQLSGALTLAATDFIL